MRRSKYICMIIHGPYGVGKTTLAHSAPGPRIAFDTEGGTYDIDKEIYLFDVHNLKVTNPDDTEVEWNGGAHEFPKDCTVILDIPDWDTYRKGMDIVLSGDHPFRTVVLDSLTELQTQLKDKIRPHIEVGDDYKKNTYDVWDQLLVHMERDVRALRNMSRPSSNRQVNTVIVAASDTEVLPRKPLIQGSLRKKLPGFVDLEGYLTTIVDQNGDTRRVMQIAYSEAAEAKCRLRTVQKINGDMIYDPNIKTIIKQAIEEA